MLVSIGHLWRNAKECRKQCGKQTYLDIYLPGMILSGPFLEVISVNSLNILAAFFASDFRLEGIGLFTERLKTYYSEKRNLVSEYISVSFFSHTIKHLKSNVRKGNDFQSSFIDYLISVFLCCEILQMANSEHSNSHQL